MNSFIIGTVLEPETSAFKTKTGDKLKLSFGLLSGRTSILFDVWSDDDVFEKVATLSDGDSIIAIVAPAIDKNGHLRYYLRKCAEAPEGLRAELNGLFQ